jgi:hypothetical protein
MTALLPSPAAFLVVWPEWAPEAALWLALALLVAAGATALAAWTLVRRLEEARASLAALDGLAEIQRTLARLLAQRDELDLKRVEHLLVDLREGSKRVEELLARAEEQRAAAHERDALVPALAPALGERVLNRLTALGYERIEIVTPNETLEQLAGASGDVLIEARRDGVLCKGRVRVRGGRIDSVSLQPAFPVFP